MAAHCSSAAVDSDGTPGNRYPMVPSGVSTRAVPESVASVQSGIAEWGAPDWNT
jgi:hypothetical protein